MNAKVYIGRRVHIIAQSVGSNSDCVRKESHALLDRRRQAYFVHTDKMLKEGQGQYIVWWY